MYLPFFNLNGKPFTYLTPNPRFLYYAPQYLSIKRKTEYVVSERSGHLYLYGPIGSGKTTLLKTISQMLLEDERNVVNFLNAPNLKTANALLRRICASFGVKTERSYSATLENLTTWLVEQYRGHRFPVLIIDEAQNVVRDGLKTLQLLRKRAAGLHAPVLAGTLAVLPAPMPARMLAPMLARKLARFRAVGRSGSRPRAS